MHKLDRITINPEMMNGQPCIRDMRLTVKRVLEALAVYPDWDDLMAEYPGLEHDDIRQALELAAHSLDDEVIGLGAASAESYCWIREYPIQPRATCKQMNGMWCMQ
ncbi:MAG: DUF433 domain-containing protein [Ketobacteraceae bacterium]|nr:DUF433 domain-containing protein [Ketobacteraceae bacterium]